MKPSFHVIKIESPPLIQALKTELEAEGNETIKDGDSVFVAILITTDEQNQGQMVLFPGYNSWSTAPGKAMYDELSSMVGKEVAWDDAPEKVRREYTNEAGEFDFGPDDPTGIAIPLL